MTTEITQMPHMAFGHHYAQKTNRTRHGQEKTWNTSIQVDNKEKE